MLIQMTCDQLSEYRIDVSSVEARQIGSTKKCIDFGICIEITSN